MKTGRYTLGNLLTNPEIEQIIIPELQRDYVWSPRNVEGLLNSVISNFKDKQKLTLQIHDEDDNEIDSAISEYLSSEYMKLRYSTRVGFIYAYHDLSAPGQYFLIDGQQRITTLFLMLLAAMSNSDPADFRKKYFNGNLPKLDYRVRDVSHRFLVDFIEFELEHGKTDAKFKDSEKYYSEYDRDVTAKAIYDNYYSVIVPHIAQIDSESFAEYLENYVEFNYFDTNMSRQGEKLYLYMNSRGESLSDQERIKPVMVSRSDDKLEAGSIWEDWQNMFWQDRKRGQDPNADRGFFEFLKWSVILHIFSLNAEDCLLTPQYAADGSRRSRNEEVEAYIRIETPGSDGDIRQKQMIADYIFTNESFSMEWLCTMMKAYCRLKSLYANFSEMQFGDEQKHLTRFVDPGFTEGYSDTVKYFAFLGTLRYLLEFPNARDADVVRLGMFLKNLQSSYDFRRNPQTGVRRVLDFVGVLAANGIQDIRLLQANRHNDNLFKDKVILRKDDLRLPYFMLDWQNEQKSGDGNSVGFGRWELLFWQMIQDKEANDFLRGDANFIVRLILHSNYSSSVPGNKILKPEEVWSSFVGKIFKRRSKDELRRELMKYGEISIYDADTNSTNFGRMERWCLLRNNDDETYWHTFLTNPDCIKMNVPVVYRLIADIPSDYNPEKEMEAISDHLGYMEHKYYLWNEGEGVRKRVILLKKTQASLENSEELPVRWLVDAIGKTWKEAYLWNCNCVCMNFHADADGVEVMPKGKGEYYMTVEYRYAETGGLWIMYFGRREGDLGLSDSFAQKLVECCGCSVVEKHRDNALVIETEIPICQETVHEPFFDPAQRVQTLATQLVTKLLSLSTNNNNLQNLV